MREELFRILKEHDVLFVGMGNRFKTDDGVGVYLGSKLREYVPNDVLIVEGSIENYIGRISQSPHS